MVNYIVEGADCISSIAEKFGFSPDTIWNNSANAELKKKRPNPNVLHKGDLVFIPEKQLREEQGVTEKRHRFRRKGMPETLRIRLLDEFGKPRIDLPYELELNNKIIKGETNENGELSESIPPDAIHAKLWLDEERDEEIVLELGRLDPCHKISGFQARLCNLGYACGLVDGKLGPQTQRAISEFQSRYDDLSETGELDESTVAKLELIHGH